MADEPAIRNANEAEAEAIHQLVNLIAAMIQPVRVAHMQAGDAANGDSRLATALATYCGCITGELLGMGMMGDEHLEPMRDMMIRNFDRGVVAGQRKCERVAVKVAQEEMRENGQGKPS